MFIDTVSVRKQIHNQVEEEKKQTASINSNYKGFIKITPLKFLHIHIRNSLESI